MIMQPAGTIGIHRGSPNYFNVKDEITTPGRSNAIEEPLVDSS